MKIRLVTHQVEELVAKRKNPALVARPCAGLTRHSRPLDKTQKYVGAGQNRTGIPRNQWISATLQPTRIYAKISPPSRVYAMLSPPGWVYTSILPLDHNPFHKNLHISGLYITYLEAAGSPQSWIETCLPQPTAEGTRVADGLFLLWQSLVTS